MEKRNLYIMLYIFKYEDCYCRFKITFCIVQTDWNIVVRYEDGGIINYHAVRLLLDIF